MVTCSPRRARTSSNIAARSCIAKSLKARVGPWNSSSSQSSPAEMAQGCGGGMVEVGIGAPGQPQQVGLVEAAGGEGGQQAGRECRVVEPAQRSQLAGGEGRPALRHEQPAILGEPGQQHLLEAAPPGLAAGADVVDHRGSVMAGRDLGGKCRGLKRR